MAIQKKSLVSALKATKKANIASAKPEAEKVNSMRVASTRSLKATSLRSMRASSTRSMRRSTRSMRKAN